MCGARMWCCSKFESVRAATPPEAKNGTKGAKTCIMSHAAPQASSNVQRVRVRGLGSSRGLHP